MDKLYQQLLLICADNRPRPLHTAASSDFCPRFTLCVARLKTDTPDDAHKITFECYLKNFPEHGCKHAAFCNRPKQFAEKFKHGLHSFPRCPLWTPSGFDFVLCAPLDLELESNQPCLHTRTALQTALRRPYKTALVLRQGCCLTHIPSGSLPTPSGIQSFLSWHGRLSVQLCGG